MLMAATERPAPADRMPILLGRLLPGRALRIEFAVSLGSFAGTPELGCWSARRAAEVLRAVVKAGAAERIGRVGRALEAPAAG